MAEGLSGAEVDVNFRTPKDVEHLNYGNTRTYN